MGKSSECFRMTAGVRTGKAQNEHIFYRFAPESGTNLPILELLPPPALSERRHRGLARRAVAVRRRAVVVWLKASVHTMARQPARELLDQINPPGEPNDSLDDI